MAKHTFSKSELMERLSVQLENLRYDCEGFDSGKFELASSIAVKIRVMCRETKNSKSLIKQCGLNHLNFLDTAPALNSASYMSWHPMVSLILHSPGNDEPIQLSYKARLSELVGKGSKDIGFNKWWDDSVIISFPGSQSIHSRDVWTRSRLVGIFSDNFGGAHVDSSIDEIFMQLEKEEKHSWKTYTTDSVGNMTFKPGKSSQNGGPHHHSVRQIAFELFESLRGHY